MFGWLKKNKSAGQGPDFSGVDTRAAAEQFVARGELAKLHLLPPPFGGTDDPHNMVYVPGFVVELKRSTDENTVRSLAQQGKVSKYVASPQYQGKSVVPTAIEVHASNPGDFRLLIRIWGDGLKG